MYESAKTDIVKEFMDRDPGSRYLLSNRCSKGN